MVNLTPRMLKAWGGLRYPLNRRLAGPQIRSEQFGGRKNLLLTPGLEVCTWGVQVIRYPNFFSRGMEADRNVKVVGGDVAVL